MLPFFGAKDTILQFVGTNDITARRDFAGADGIPLWGEPTRRMSPEVNEVSPSKVLWAWVNGAVVHLPKIVLYHENLM